MAEQSKAVTFCRNDLAAEEAESRAAQERADSAREHRRQTERERVRINARANQKAKGLGETRKKGEK